MTLGEKQRLFAELVGQLITWIYNHERQYAVTFGDAYRDPRAFGQLGESVMYGRKYSNHKIRLAIDLNLFIRDESGRWVYQTSTEAHRPIGEYWESLSPLCSWGGHFDDGNHYSIEHEGRR